MADQLLHELAATFTDTHRADGSVTRMRIRAENHLSAAGHLLTHILVEDTTIRRYEDTAELLCIG